MIPRKEHATVTQAAMQKLFFVVAGRSWPARPLAGDSLVLQLNDLVGLKSVPSLKQSVDLRFEVLRTLRLLVGIDKDT